MGYNTSSSTLTLTAKLTPIGRKRFATNLAQSIIAGFSLGDSDANYYASNALSTGQVPSIGGDIGPSSSLSNSTTNNVNIKSLLMVNSKGVLIKPIELQSSRVTSEVISNGQVTISGANLTQVIIDRNNANTDSLVNLFYSFGLPLTSINDATYTATTYEKGGYADTALSGVANNKIVALAINNNSYGELIDGKAVKLVLPTSAGTFTIYSTFENKGGNILVEDANLTDTSVIASSISNNVAFLFSDQVAKPNQSSTLSWGTGFGLQKPFSKNGKQFFNLQTNSNMNISADTLVGVVYLDKGFLVITNPTIVSAYTTTAATGATLTLNSVSTNVVQNVTCIADRGEFGASTNPTFGPNDVPRISEVALLDNIGNIVAIAKTDRHISKNINEFLALAIKIVL